MCKLLEPLKIKTTEFKNRIGMSPMCMYSAYNGFASDWHLVHYGNRALGGCAFIIQEATAISPEGRISPNDLGIWSDDHISGLWKITQFIENLECIPGIQLAHAGRKASHASPWNGGAMLCVDDGGWECVAPSALKFEESDSLPHPLSENEIEEIISGFVLAAKRAVLAGYKIIEIHAAHGYLIHQFLSPLSNQRTDKYGGEFENRIRLLLEVVREIKKAVPDEIILFVRISATDWVDGGWDEFQSVELAKLLKTEGVDLIDVSSGGLVPFAKIPVSKGYQIPFSAKIRTESNIKTSAVGLITTFDQAQEIIDNAQADLVMLGRELLRNPYFPLKIAAENNCQMNWPKQYLRGKFL